MYPRPVATPHSSTSGTLLRYLIYDPAQTAPVVSLDPAGNPSYLEVDRIGSVIATSSGASLANTYSYLPYGDTSSGTLSGTASGYAGYRFDAETGTYHTRTRTYDPRIGRFLRTDPIGQQGGLNIYAYAQGNPINNTDIAGTQPAGADSLTNTAAICQARHQNPHQLHTRPNHPDCQKFSKLTACAGRMVLVSRRIFA